MSPRYRVCAQVGCGNVYEARRGVHRCPEHQNVVDQRRAAKKKALAYDSENWQAVRLARLQLAAGRCELRLERCTGRATHVHLDPRLRGRHEIATVEDCRACCAPCSGSVDAARAHESRREGRP